MLTVEFDGRIATVAWEEAGGQYQDAESSSSCIDRRFLPERASGANSTHMVDTLLVDFIVSSRSSCLRVLWLSLIHI